MLLEQPRKSGSKVISHMLSSHGGEIFLHVLNSNRSTLEDPPSISEGCGGRVTDYRITVRPTPRSFPLPSLIQPKSFLGFRRVHEGEPAHARLGVPLRPVGEAPSGEGQSPAGALHPILANDHLPDHHLQHAGGEQHCGLELHVHTPTKSNTLQIQL